MDDKTVSRDAGYIDVGPWNPPALSSEDVITANEAIGSPPVIRLHAGKKLVRVVKEKNVPLWKDDPHNYIGVEVHPESDKEISHGDVVILTRTSPPIM